MLATLLVGLLAAPAVRADEPARSTTIEVLAASPADGLSLRVSGAGYRDLGNACIDATCSFTLTDGVYVAVIDSQTDPVSMTQASGMVGEAVWVKQSAIVDGVFSTDLTLPAASLSAAQTYQVIVWRAHGLAYPGGIYANQTLALDGAERYALWGETSAAVIATSPLSTSVTEGQDVVLTSSATGGYPAPVLTWQRIVDGQWVAVDDLAASDVEYVATGDSLTVSGLTAADSGARFRAMFTNEAAAVPSEEAVVTVAPRDVPTAPQPTLSAASITIQGLAAIRYGTRREVAVLVRSTGAVPTGTVVLRSHGKILGTGRLVASGSTASRAVIAVSGTALEPGKHTVGVDYAGDARTKAASATAAWTVSRSAAKIVVKVAKAINKSKRAKATVKVTAPGAGTVSGTVVIRDGKKKIASAKLKTGSRGTVKVKLPRLKKAGKHTLTVVYKGSATVAAATARTKLKVKR